VVLSHFLGEILVEKNIASISKVLLEMGYGEED
jgi:hypothetical protein